MTNKSHLVLSALGPDRGGLVSDVTHFLRERNGNVEDSRMAVLGGEFGLLVLVSGEAAKLDQIERDAPLLEQKTGLGILIRRTRATDKDDPSPNSKRYIIKAESLDHQGIVSEVATALHRFAANIVTLESGLYSAPVTGSPLFRLRAVLDVPLSTPEAELARALSDVGQAQNIDIEFQRETSH